MSGLSDLYQELILHHSRKPRNFGPLADANREAEGFNPLCGDKVKIFVRLEDDVVRDVHFQGAGCAISTASASVMTEEMKGKTLAEVQTLFRTFHDLVTGKTPADVPRDDLGKLEAFAGVSEFPARVKCATLAWHTLQAALHGEQRVVSTESTPNE